jgi:hypothetical protein
MSVDKKAISERRARLDQARQNLQRHFVGIDGIIDELCRYIQVWYLMPEVLVRPVIVNLWGMTGTGKTDLVRRLVRELDLMDRFAEVELSNIDTTTSNTSVSAILGRNKLNDGKPAIVLFDEIQRFNTLDAEGKPLETTKFTDFWELLSDGKLSRKDKDDIDYWLRQLMFGQSQNRRKKEQGQEADASEYVDFWDTNSMLDSLGIEMAPESMAELTKAQMLEHVVTAKRQKRVHQPVDHSKTLIIISGNLDDAFSMSHQVSETDVDADIFHAFTLKITDTDVKNALAKKFRPEQVARFGNIHLIYRSLRKQDFETLIGQEIIRRIAITKERFGIDVVVDEGIAALIYRNGVFPAQGVRPVLSTLADLFETNLSMFLFEAIMADVTSISLRYDEAGSELVATIGPATHRIACVGRIDRIRASSERDRTANVSVHEAGHAVAYMVLMGLAPLQVMSRLASSSSSGFTFPHLVYETHDALLAKVKVLLAGGIAEELIFGEGNASTGRAHDRIEATRFALDFVRAYGFDREFQAHYGLSEGHAMDKFTTDADVEKMMVRLVGETRELLSRNIGLLRTLSAELMRDGRVTASRMRDMASAHAVSCEVQTEGFLKIPAFANLLEGSKA